MTYKAHQLADIFPIIEGEELKELISDIKKNGLIDPIVLYDGKILDGRNRYNACNAAGVEPRFTEYNGENPISFVVSKNIRRRHLTSVQAAALANTIANITVGGDGSNQHKSNSACRRNSKTSQTEAAKLTGASTRTMQRLKKIKEKNPKLHDAVVDGAISATAAESIIKQEIINESSNQSIQSPVMPETKSNPSEEVQFIKEADTDMTMTIEIAERYLAHIAMGAEPPSSSATVRDDVDFYRDIIVKYSKTDEDRQKNMTRTLHNGATTEGVVNYIRGYLAAKKHTVKSMRDLVTEEIYNSFRRENSAKIQFAESYHPSWGLPHIPLKQAEYAKLLHCLHPDRVARFNDPELTEMFREGLELVQKLKMSISKPDDFREPKYPKTPIIPPTWEEYRAQELAKRSAAGKKAAETRKANKASKSSQPSA